MARRAACAPIRSLAGLAASRRSSFDRTRAEAMKIQSASKAPAASRPGSSRAHANPLIAMRFAFQGGAAQDPAGKEGLAHFVSGMMDEGAGDLDVGRLPGAHAEDRHAHGLRRRPRRHARQCADADREQGRGRSTCCARAHASRASMPTPSSACAARSGRTRKFDENDPEERRLARLDRLAFPDHPYGRPDQRHGPRSPR